MILSDIRQLGSAAVSVARPVSVLFALSAVMLTGCKSSGEVAADPDPAPSVSISASPSSIDSGQSTTLTWNASNADSCSASGGWSGAKSTSGNEQVGPLTATNDFTLTCSGSGGQASDSVTVTVSSPTPAPTLNFSVSPASISSGSSATLTWSTTNADSCTASGAWLGPKPVSGSESTGTLTNNASYTLRCSGPGGDISVTRTVSVTSGGPGDGISGKVDSSLINRSGQNAVYLFAGTVTPDDIDGDAGDPVATAVVQQDTGACTFGYDFGSVAAGDYTLAFTSDAANDNPQSNDTISFYGTTNLTVGSNGAMSDFAAASILRVGPGRPYQTVAAAANAAQDGDVIEIDAGLYPADVASWYQDNLTIRGVGGYAHLRADGADAQGKAIWVIVGNNTVVENIEFSEITVPSQNGSGIRQEGRDLVVCNGYFHDSDEGILGGFGNVLIEYSEFDNNGYGDGFSHNMYIESDTFTLRYSYIHRAIIGHNVKSRARENHILYNRIMDETTGNSSYAIDIPNGGLTYIIGNLLQQGPNTDNAAIVNYGTEGLSSGRTHNLYVVNNTLVDDFGGVFIQTASGTSLVRTINNLFVGGGTQVTGASANATTNLQTTAPGLIDLDGFDYRLTSASPARDAGSAPGLGNGFDLTPRYQYLHEKNREDRPTDATIDIGAYEFTP